MGRGNQHSGHITGGGWGLRKPVFRTCKGMGKLSKSVLRTHGPSSKQGVGWGGGQIKKLALGGLRKPVLRHSKGTGFP